MQSFEVKLDLSKVQDKLKNHKKKLREYSVICPVITVTANDPDEACHLIYHNFFNLLLGFKPKIAIADLDEIKYDIRIESAKVMSYD